jgi:hypothetical protein
MASIVTSKPDHYERLGLAPDAGAEEIARAFATAMSPLMPRSVGDLVEIAIAFETLRNPVKRRAYDASIAPALDEPEPAPAPVPETGPDPEVKLMFPREGWPVTPSTRIGSMELPAIDALPRMAEKDAPTPCLAPPLQAEAPRVSEPQLDYRPAEGRFRYLEQAPVEWRRPAAVVGALFVGVAMIGAGLGWYASRGIAPAQAEDSVTFPIPKSEAPLAEAPPQTAAVAVAVKAKPEHRTRPAGPPARAHRAAPVSEPVVAEEQRADDVPDIPSETVAALASQPAEAATAMPLPDSVIARTIGRIGYACGEVASTTAIDGAPGVFKVNCASGDSYRAAPVRGRYHFKRWSGR